MNVPFHRSLAVALGTVLLVAAPASAQPLTTKTVNLDSPLPTPIGQLDFPFTHRFSILGSKVVSSPTFTLSTGVIPRTSLALRYATNSDVNPSAPGAFNEWEPTIKHLVTSQDSGGPFDLSAILAYNTAASSTDGALVLARRWGPVSLLGTARGFSNGFGQGASGALGAGLQWHLTRYLQLSGDVLQASTGAMPAWSVATSFEIPYSPHSVSLYVTNANTHTLEGTSRGSTQLRGGFEFLIPFTSWARWGAIFNPPSETPASPTPASPTPASQPLASPSPASGTPASATPQATPSVSAGEVQVVAIANLKFGPPVITVKPGTTVRWENRDVMDHTATSTQGKWDSGLIRPGQSWSMRFDEVGTYPYLCTPHPFMTGTVEVR